MVFGLLLLWLMRMPWVKDRVEVHNDDAVEAVNWSEKPREVRDPAYKYIKR